MAIVPQRLRGLPDWLSSTQINIDSKQVYDDMLSIAFWAAVDKQANDAATQKVRDGGDWKRKLKLADQSADVRLKHSELVAQHTDDLIRQAETSDYVRNRLLAAGADLAYDKISQIESVSEQVKTRILLFMNENGLFGYMEAGSAEEYLLTKIAGGDKRGWSTGKISEVTFMLTYLLPIMEANGFPKEQILGVTQNFWKVRYAIKDLRQALDQVIQRSAKIREQMKSADEDEKVLLEQALQETFKVEPRLHEVLNTLVESLLNKKETTADMLRKLRQTSQKTVTVTGYRYSMMSGTALTIFFEKDEEAQRRAVENQISGLVDLRNGDIKDIVTMLSKYLLGEDGNNG